MTNLTVSSLTVCSGVSDLLPLQYSFALMFFTLGLSFFTCVTKRCHEYWNVSAFSHSRPIFVLSFRQGCGSAFIFADPDPAVLFNADPDPADLFNADPDPAAFYMRMRIQPNKICFKKYRYRTSERVEKDKKDCSKVKNHEAGPNFFHFQIFFLQIQYRTTVGTIPGIKL